MSNESRLIVCGDTHGSNVELFSYRNHPEFKNLDENDVVVILGDTAIGWPGFDGITKNSLRHVNDKPFTVVYMFGNHDNYDWSATLPLATEESKARHNVSGEGLRQVVWDGVTYESQFVCDSPMIADMAGYHCLMIPGADSHDIDEIYFPEEKSEMMRAKRGGELYRTIGRSWWGGEAIDVRRLSNIITEDVRAKEHFDLVLSHDCPASFLKKARPHGGTGDFMEPTVGEKYLEALYRTIDYEFWFHGHMHYDFYPYYNFYQMDHNYFDSCCLYSEPYEVKELGDLLQAFYRNSKFSR